MSHPDGLDESAMTLEEAWFAVHDELPPRWQVGRASISDPARGTWSVSAIGPHPGRSKLPTVVTGTGESEIEALRSLWACLTRRAPDPDADRKGEELRRRLRLAWLQGAGDVARDDGRIVSADELERAIERFPGP